MGIRTGMMAPMAIFAVLALGACATTTSGETGMTEAAPAALPLAGAEWAVSSINGQPVIKDSKVTMQFEDGRVYGAGSCNRFMGGYTPGEGLTIQLSQMASTMMACPEDLMNQESLFLKTLGDVTGYSIDGATATLRTEDGRTIVATRP